jgi:AcrR family transcriptional regulator
MSVGRTVSTEDFLDAALNLLVTQGPGTIKVATVCTEVGVTTGSFYGHFSGLDDFVTTLLANRLSQQDRSLFELADSVDEPGEVLTQLRALLHAAPRTDEAALRAWAASHPVAARLQRRLDRERAAALAVILCKLVPADQCRRLAEVGMALLIGYQHLYADTDGMDRDSVFDEFETMVLRHRTLGPSSSEANKM